MRFLSLMILLFPLLSWGNQTLEWIPSGITMIKDSVNPSLGTATCKVHLVLGNSEIRVEQPLILQGELNQVYTRWELGTTSHSAEQLVQAGTSTIALFLSPNYEPIAPTTFRFEGGHEVWLYCYFASKINEYFQVEKPVIYTYAAKPASVAIQVEPNGTMLFTYPTYRDAWKGMVDEKGMFTQEGVRYPYLFWEAELPIAKLEVNWNQSTIVPTADVLSFLEKQLDIIGLNQKEKTDFITYWGPQLVAYPKVEILFLQNKEVEQLASLKCSDPQFHIERLYLLFRVPDASNKRTSVQNNLQPMQRTDFLMVEWGGGFIPEGTE
jgi:hypothetical protein